MSKSRAVGTRFESEVRDYFNEGGFFCVERRALNGALDKGDLSGIPAWTLECKNERTITLAAYMQEVEVEKANARTPYGAAIVKRRNKGVADAYVVMPLYQFKVLLARGDWT